MSPPQLSQPQQGSIVDRGNVFQQSVQQIEDQHEKLVIENQQLESQVQDQTEARAKLSWLEKTDGEHRSIADDLRKLTGRYPGPLGVYPRFVTFHVGSYAPGFKRFSCYDSQKKRKDKVDIESTGSGERGV